ncbi:MAG: TolC family protein, partial [Desulfurobacteriaceae bacterium]
MKLLTAALFTLIPLSAYAVTPEEVVKYLLNNSLDIKSAKKSVEKERISRAVTEREFFPEINLSASFSEFYPDFKESWNQKYSLGATVSAEPINFQRFVKLEIDSTRIKAKEEKLKETLLEQLFLALKELYNLKAYQERILFKEESLNSAKEILKVAQEKYKKGLVMITDVLKAKSQVENVKGELSKLKAQYRQSFNRLNELLNFSLSEEEKPQFEFLKEKVRVEKRELLKSALEMRPEVKKAKEEVKENSLRVKYSRRTLSPRLKLSFSWNRSGTSFWPEDRNYSAGVSLSFPIFDSGLTTY